jgi:hypothetical protein
VTRRFESEAVEGVGHELECWPEMRGDGCR